MNTDKKDTGASIVVDGEEIKLHTVIMGGYTRDNHEYFYTTSKDRGAVMVLLERMRQQVMESDIWYD